MFEKIYDIWGKVSPYYGSFLKYAGLYSMISSFHSSSISESLGNLGIGAVLYVTGEAHRDQRTDSQQQTLILPLGVQQALDQQLIQEKVEEILKSTVCDRNTSN